MAYRDVQVPRHLPPRVSSLLEVGVYFLLILLCVGEGVPGINESHYLPKAKHVWDSRFAAGDLFLQSHDAHYWTSALAGLAARLLPLAGVAWLGRIVSWGLLAWAWRGLGEALQLPKLLRPFALLSWLLGVHYGHWAGEWVVGGFEAKTLAYPLVIWGLAAMVRGQWQKVWLAMGGAMAWHPVVGGWAGLSAGLVWLAQGDLPRQFPRQLPWLLGGAALALLGVVPAAAGLGGPDVIDNVSAAQVHVYLRLPHHLAPQLFAASRHWAAAASLVALLVASGVYLAGLARGPQSQPQPQPPAQAGGGRLSDGLGRLLLCGWIAVLFAAAGWLIDWTLSVPRPDIAARLLRFYWFRWADVAVPLVTSLVCWKALERGLPAASPSPSPSHSRPSSSTPAQTAVPAGHPSWLARALLVAAVAASLLGIASRLQLGQPEVIPPADRLVVHSAGKHAADTDRYVDWLAVCQWIRENTPPDSLWLTPKYQQSFKWHAERAEVVCWKDVPQDNAAVIEWYHRIQRCAPPRDRWGQIRSWTTDELLDLAAIYGFRWVLLDRSYQSSPPALEIKYPLIEQGQYIDNRSFAVMYIPDALLPPAP